MSSSENKDKYRAFCRTEATIPIFSRDWWLDAVAGSEWWDVAVVERDSEIVASFPYVFKRIPLVRIIGMPRLTQTMGIWMSYPEWQKVATRLGYEKRIVTELIDNLPRFDIFKQRFHYSFTNWLPFFWRGFRQTTRYTYILEDISDLDRVYSEFRENIRREIKKAERLVEVSCDEDVELIYNLQELTFKRQNKRFPFSLELLRRVDSVCKERNCRKMFFAKDHRGRVHAALYFVWDEESGYYLLGGADPDLRTSGATSFLMWEAIKFASSVTRRFDFEGSMIESVERFFRGFGAIQKPYFYIYKRNNIFKFFPYTDV